MNLVIVELIRFSGYFSFKKIPFKFSHSSANRSSEDDRQWDQSYLFQVEGRFEGFCLANVNVNGKHLRQIKKISNSAYRSSIVETAFWKAACEEWGENEKDCARGKVGKGNCGCFSCGYDRLGGEGRLLV